MRNPALTPDERDVLAFRRAAVRWRSIAEACDTSPEEKAAALVALSLDKAALCIELLAAVRREQDNIEAGLVEKGMTPRSARRIVRGT